MGSRTEDSRPTLGALDDDQLLRQSDVLSLLAITSSTLDRFIKQGIVNPGFKMGKARRWRVRELRVDIEKMVTGS